MYCKNCGAELEDGLLRCPQCGAEVTQEPTAPVEESADPAAVLTETPVGETASEEFPAEPAGEDDSADAETAAEPSDGGSVPTETGTEPAEGETAPAELPKKKEPVALLVTLAVVAIAALVVLVIALTGGKKDGETPDGSADERVEATDPDDQTDDADPTAMEHVDAEGNFVAHSFTSAEALTPERAETVVANAGDNALTNQELSYYFWGQYINLASTYGGYLSYILDPDTPLAEQMYDDTHSWEDMMLQSAMRTFWQTKALLAAAEEDGYTLDPSYEEYLATMPESMNKSAQDLGMESGEAYLQSIYGAYATLDSYAQFLHDSVLASSYFNSLVQAIDYEDSDISAYFDENQELYASQGLSKDDPNMINVRHILIMPEADEDAEKDENGEVILTEENWAEAKARAEELLAQWQAGEATEESFSALVEENSDDPGSQSVGGLYEDVYPGQMEQAFNDWCFEAGRQPGDTGIVETGYGYHIMYFSGTSDRAHWQDIAEDDYLADRQSQLLQDITGRLDFQVDYDKVALQESASRD